MKKIFSWIASSFFRQVGRFLFFIVLGLVFVLLFNYNNIKIPYLNDLFGFEYVKGATITQEVSAYGFSTINQGSYESWMGGSWNRTDERFHWEFSPSDNKQAKVFRVNLDNKNLSGHDFIEIAIAFTTEGGVYSTTNNQETCDTWAWSIENNNSYNCSSWAYVDNGQRIVIPSDIGSLNVGINAIMEDNTKSYCWIQNDMVVCPVYKKRIKEVWFEVFYRAINYSEYQGKLFIELDRNFMYYDSSSPTSAIESQTQQQEQQHNETMNFFNDTNTTSDSNSTASFFTETNTTSESALASIVSAPVSLLNNLATGTYNDLCATLNNKQICLPSGAIIWDRENSGHGGSGVHDNGQRHWFSGGSVQGFKDFFNLVVGGYILYKCLISLFIAVHRLLDPTDSWVQVMKL